MSEHCVRSPLPGLFYRRPAPTAPPFAEVGDYVTAQQSIGVVEVMKQYFEVNAEVSGRIVNFVAENEAVLGPGDVVATIESD